MPLPGVLDTRAFLEIIRKMPPLSDLFGVTLFDRRPHDSGGATWMVRESDKGIATFTGPDDAADTIQKMAQALKTSNWLHTREKKTLPPSVLRWIKAPADDQSAGQYAEEYIRDESQDMLDRIERTLEWLVWQALTGTITVTVAGVSLAVDFDVPSANKPSPNASWATAGTDIYSDIVAWKKQVATASGVMPTDVVIDSTTLGYMFNNTALQKYLTDELKRQFAIEGSVPNYLGMKWTVYDLGYTSGGSAAQYVAAKTLRMFARSAGRILEGPVPDLDAPNNLFGRYAKTWKSKDPSSWNFLVDWTGMVILRDPSAVLYCSDVTTP